MVSKLQAQFDTIDFDNFDKDVLLDVIRVDKDVSQWLPNSTEHDQSSNRYRGWWGWFQPHTPMELHCAKACKHQARWLYCRRQILPHLLVGNLSSRPSAQLERGCSCDISSNYCSCCSYNEAFFELISALLYYYDKLNLFWFLGTFFRLSSLLFENSVSFYDWKLIWIDIFKLCQSTAPISSKNIKSQEDPWIPSGIRQSPGPEKKPLQISSSSSNSLKTTQNFLHKSPPIIPSAQVAKRVET